MSRLTGPGVRRGGPARRWLPLALLLPGALPLSAQSGVSEPTVVTLGACRLQSGARIEDCRVAYRAYGRPNAAGDNVVLVPTYFAGRSEDHAFMLGTYVDTLRYHVVIVDALGDGRSSSPSNTMGASRQAFAALTIADMVEAQRRLLQEHLGIDRVRAVVGISMGGFQAFEWAVRHPGLADVVVSVVGTPRPTVTDRLVYAGLAAAAEASRVAGASGTDAWVPASRIETLFMGTRGGLEEQGDERVQAELTALAAAYDQAGWDLDDYAAQARALRSHDVAGGTDDLERAARAVRARMLVIVSSDDRMVSPGPALEFAGLAGAETLVVPSACGHAVFWCEAETLGAAVRAFLDREPVADGAAR